MADERTGIERRIGETVLGRYTLESVIGLGGQGAVFRAADRTTGGSVAIKLLLDQADRDPTARERIAREVHALEALAGTAAVRVLDQGFTPDGRFCLVQELLVGNDLERELSRVEAEGRVFQAADIPFLFGPIVATLERAHSLGIVHRDLKPENIYLEKREGRIRVRLLDFGFAKFRHKSALTMEGFVAGSPTYIAPETWRQQPVTASVDTYAVSAMMFRVLAGRPPFVERDIVALMKAVSAGPRPDLRTYRPELPAAVDAWSRRALAIEPTDRFSGPRASYEALCSALGVSPD